MLGGGGRGWRAMANTKNKLGSVRKPGSWGSGEPKCGDLKRMGRGSSFYKSLLQENPWMEGAWKGCMIYGLLKSV